MPLLEKVSLDTADTPSHCPAFHKIQLSGNYRTYVRHGRSQPTSYPSSRCPQDPAPAPPQLSGTTPASSNHSSLSALPAARCVCACVPFPDPQQLYKLKFLLGPVCDLPDLVGVGAWQLLSLTLLSSDVFPAKILLPVRFVLRKIS